MMTQKDFEARIKRAAEGAIKASKERQQQKPNHIVKTESVETVYYEHSVVHSYEPEETSESNNDNLPSTPING